jgi:hypothetical protein
MNNDKKENYCLYYTARLDRSRCWLVSSLLRGTEHVAFDRSFDPQKSIFEFFVPEAMESVFLQVMEYLQKKQVVSELVKGSNRLATGGVL